MVVIAAWSSMGCHCIFKTLHLCFVNIYRHGDLKPMSFAHIVTSILDNDSFLLLRLFFVSITQILQFVHLFFPY